ncbi:MAG: hypothetical protein V3V25_08160 [Paracoccaceae bacterium]
MRLPVLTLLLLGYSGLSAAIFATEWQAFSFDGQQPKFGFRPGPLSLAANHNILRKCDALMTAPLALFQPEIDLQKTAASCADIATRVTSWMPTHGFAHFVSAQSAHHLGDTTAREMSLDLSQQYSPFEGWLAQRRFSLISDQPQAWNAAFQFDISTMLTTQTGAELLANFYVFKPQTRTVLTETAASSLGRNQTRFLNQLQQRQANK